MKLVASLSFVPFVFYTAAYSQQRTHAKNVMTYYLSLPPEVLELKSDIDGHLLSKEEKEKIIAFADVENGYLQIKSKDLTGVYTIKLFERKSASALLGMLQDGSSVQNIKFFTPSKKNWSEVTSSVFPKISDEFVISKYLDKKPGNKKFSKDELKNHAHSLVRYQFPIVGATIVASPSWGFNDAAVEEVELFKLKFDGKKFSLID